MKKPNIVILKIIAYLSSSELRFSLDLAITLRRFFYISIKSI